MTDTLCTVPRCHYPRPEHSFVCLNCADLLKADLDKVPSMLDELETTITRQDVLGSQNGKAKSAETALPFKWGASEALWVLGNVITTWARMLVEHTGTSHGYGSTQAEAARFLQANVTSLVMHPAGGEAVDEIEYAVKAAVKSVDQPVDPRLYLGKCGDITGQKGCQGRVYALPRQDNGTCQRCAEEHSTIERRALMLRKASNRVLPAADMSTMLAGLGIEISVAEIQNVGRLGRIKAQATDVHGKRSYRVGDVLREYLGHDFLAA